MASPFRVELIQEEQLPDLVGLIVPTFAKYPLEQIIGNIDTPEAILAATERHRQSWNDYQAETGRTCGVRCMHVDPTSGEETMVAAAEWFIYPRARSPVDTQQILYLISDDWVSEDENKRQRAKSVHMPVHEARVKWLSGRGHAVLMYMATHEKWRRKGAATACVQWGLDRCNELGIPAYLEASAEGRPVYEKLGFEIVEEIPVELDGVKQIERGMMWWPPGTKNEDKKPLRD